MENNNIQDYTSWYLSFEDIMELSHKEVLEYEGDKGQGEYTGLIVIYMQKYNLNIVEINAKGQTKKELRNKAFKKLFEYLKEKYDLTNGNINLEKKDLFIETFINKIFNTGGYLRENCMLLGGMCYKKLESEKAKTIINNLNKLELFNERIKVISWWKTRYSSLDFTNLRDAISKEEIDRLEKQFVEIYGQNNFENYEINEAVKNIEVISEIYEINDDKCPFCNVELNIRGAYIYGKYNNKGLILKERVKKCELCNIYGIEKNRYNELQDANFQINTYRGTPAYYKGSDLEENEGTIIIDLWKGKQEEIKINSDEINFIKEQIDNIAIGIVVNYEIEYLKYVGSDLALKVKKVASTVKSKSEYDVLSYNLDGSEKRIIVKGSRSKVKKLKLTEKQKHNIKEESNLYILYLVNNVGNNEFIILKRASDIDN